MANKQDVEFSLSANVSGTEKIKALRDEVTALAKQGGYVGPEFQKLADELDRLGQEAKSLGALSELAQEIEQLATGQDNAAAAAENLSGEMRQATESADAYRAAQQGLQQRLVDSREELAKARLRLAQYKLEQKELIGDTEQYRQTVRLMTEQILTHRNSIVELNAELSRAKVQTQQAEQAERKAATAYDASAKSLKEASTALESRQRAQVDAVKSLREMGVATDDLATAEATLADRLRESRLEQERLIRLNADQKVAAKEYETFWLNALYQREQAEQRTAEAARRAADQQAQALREQMAEEERLARIIERTKFEQRQAAQLELQYELEVINKVEQARLASAQKQAAAQKALQDSFKTTGATDVQALREEIGRVNAALATLQSSGRLTGAELQGAMRQASSRVKELEMQIREATGALTIMDRVNKAFSSSFGQTFAAFVASNIFMRLIDSILGIGRAFFDANKQLESFRLALTTIYGSSEVAAKQLGFLRQAANDAGLSVKDIAQSFVKFSASFADAGIPLEQTNELFARLTKAAGILGLSTDDTGRAITALGQMASKGVVSLEELRQQLGDALPGAFQIAARGLGVTEKELTKLVESGQLATRDFMPAFSQGLTSVSGEVDTMSARLNEGLNVVTVFFQKIGDTGVWLAMKAAVSGVVEILRGLAFVVGSLAIGFENAVGSITVFIAALTQGKGLKGALEAVTDQSEQGRQKVVEYAGALGYTADEAKKGAEAQGSLQRELIRSQLQYAENIKSAEKAAQTAGDHTKAVVAEVESIERSAKAFGTDTQQREAAVRAAQLRTEALNQEASAEQATLTVINEMIATRERLLETERAQLELQNLTQAQRDQVISDRQKEIDDLKKKAAAQAEVADRATKQAETSRIAAEAARLEAEAAKDNADRVRELTTEYENQATKLQILIDLKKDGLATDAQVAAQQEVVDKANKLRTDALDDQIARTKALVDNKKADIESSLALNDLRMQELRGVEALGKSIGDENLVRYANVEMMRLQIKTIELKAEAQRIEAEAEKQIIALERQKIETTRVLTETERIEFDTRTKLADVKIKQAEATRKSTEAIENEINAVRNGSASLSDNTRARQESNKVRADELRLIKEKQKYDEQGYALNTAGERVNMGMPTWLSIFNDLKGYGVDEGQARGIANQFTDANGNVPYFDNPGQRAYGGDTLSMAVLKAAQDAIRSGSTTKTEAVDASSPTSAEPTTTTTNQLAPAQNSTITMKFEIGGQTTAIAGLNQSQASGLKAVVEQLAALKGTSA